MNEIPRFQVELAEPVVEDVVCRTRYIQSLQKHSPSDLVDRAQGHSIASSGSIYADLADDYVIRRTLQLNRSVHSRRKHSVSDDLDVARRHSYGHVIVAEWKMNHRARRADSVIDDPLNGL